MKLRLAAAWAVCFGLVLAAATGVLFALHAALGPADRETFGRLLAAHGELLFWLAVVAFGSTGFLANWLVRIYLEPLLRLTDSTRLIASGNPGHRVEPGGPSQLRELAGAINLLASRHEAALGNVDARIIQANIDLDQEKNRLAALMSELAQSVVVCNAEGRILLYNERARRIFINAENGAGGVASSYLGLGRSLFALIERDLVRHALEQLRNRLAQGEAAPVAVFMTTLHNGTLARTRMAPVMATVEGRQEAPAGDVAGFVLLLEDVAEEVQRAERRDRLMERFTESTRVSLAGMRAAVENLVNFPDMDSVRRRQFTDIIRDEAGRFTLDLDRAAREYSEQARSQWSLEQIRVADLIGLIRSRVEARLALPTAAGELDSSLWANVDSYTMAQAVCYLARRLKDEFQVRDLRLDASAAGRHAQLDLVWTGARLPTSTALAWEDESLNAGGETSSITFREVLNRHHGEAWYEWDEPSRRSRFRLLLPLAEPARLVARLPARPGRPEYYDFDLFHQPGQTRELDERPLKELSYTVFDTETTGLEPSAGDEIISIGAMRIVNGRLLAGEQFEQLIDPRRSLKAASMRVHGIRPEALLGQPTLDKVLPAFHKYCEDTVLVGHNVAFDMRFFQLKEEITGVRFTQPVLDTLLLSALLHENLPSHQLEAVAERFGVNPSGRHTAAGDALMTGEVFLKMIPLLDERGIVTLKQARDACERTYYARLRY
jgi:DNA polymerase-3 subunit epsilon